MKLHVVLNDRTIASSPRARVPLRSLSVRRGDNLTIDVSFSMDGRVGPLPAGTTVSLVAYAGVGSRLPLVFATAPTLHGRGITTYYRFNAVSFALSSLGASFPTQPVIPLVFEISVGIGYGRFTTAPVRLNVTQTADIGAATPPVLEAVPSTPLYLRDIVTLTGGGATALDGVPTVGRAGLVVMCYVDSEFQTWRLFSGTDAENPVVGVVRPDDYNASSNAQVWKRIL